MLPCSLSKILLLWNQIQWHEAWSFLANPMVKVPLKNSQCLQLKYKCHRILCFGMSRTPQNFHETFRILLREAQLVELSSKIKYSIKRQISTLTRGKSQLSEVWCVFSLNRCLFPSSLHQNNDWSLNICLSWSLEFNHLVDTAFLLEQKV